MNELVQMHNDLVDLPLKQFNASELDILHTLCYEVKNRGVDEVQIGFDRIRKLSHFKGKDEKQLVESIDRTNEKLLKLNFRLGDDRDFIRFVLFTTFRVNANDQTLTVAVNKPFKYLLNNFGGNYTTFELEQSSKLKSSYSKQIFKKLKEFEDKGWWLVTVEGFREYLDIPKGFAISKIDERVIAPALEELAPLFKGLKCEKQAEDRASGKRGRPKITHYKWTFVPVKREKKEPAEPERTQEYVAKVTRYEKMPDRYCPNCYRPIYRLDMVDDNGNPYQLYGHSDFKTGPCNFHTWDIGDLLFKHQLPEDPLTEEQKATKAKLAAMMSGMGIFAKPEDAEPEQMTE